MTSYSNRPQYLVKKYWSLAFVLFPSAMMIDWINGDRIQYWSLIPAAIGFLIYFFLTSKISEVEISNESILIVSSKTKVAWMDITYFQYNSMLDIYEMDANDKTYFIAPYGFSFTFFGKKIPDEFDRLINKKKRELDI